MSFYHEAEKEELAREDEVPDHARGPGGAAGHHQADHHKVGDSPGGRGHCAGPGEEDGPEPAGVADQGHGQGRLPPVPPGHLRAWRTSRTIVSTTSRLKEGVCSSVCSLSLADLQHLQREV